MTQGSFGKIKVPGRHTAPLSREGPKIITTIGVSSREWEESLRSCDLAERVKIERIRSGK